MQETVDETRLHELLGTLIGYMTGAAVYAFFLEFNLYGDVRRNIEHPLKLGVFGYAASLNYCMTQALVVGGEGTGT